MNSLWQTEEFRNCILEKKETATATGSPLNIYPVEDGSVEPVIFGVTMQASSPTPDIPVVLNCVTGNVTAIGGVVSNSITLPTGLHGIGTSKDSLDLATGECERKVGVVAFDGSEAWSDISTYVHQIAISGMKSGGPALCSHFASGTDEGEFSISGTNFIVYTDMELADFKTWLATQLAESTPVTVAYELSASTTESFATNSLGIYANHTKIYSEAFPDDCEIVLTNVWERYEPEFDIVLSGTVGEQTVYLDGSVIKECTFDDTCTSGNNLSIGDFVGKQLDVSFFDFDGVYTDTIWNGLELSFSYIVKRPNDEWYSVKKGTFIV